MKRTACEFEGDVLAAAMESRWPEGVEASLREHGSTCPICSEAAVVACAIREDREDIRASASIPESGRVWWLSQVRARREAIAAAERPITIVQMMVFACATGLLGACFGATSEWFQASVKRFVSNPVATLLGEHVLLGLGMAAVLLLLPAAAYFVLEEEGSKLRRGK